MRGRLNMIYYNDDLNKKTSIAPFIECAMEDNPFYEEIHEKGYFKKLALPFKLRSINKKLPKDQQINDVIDRIKKHTYPAYNQYVAKCDDPDILSYLKNDLDVFLHTIKFSKDQFLKGKKLGKCSETESFYHVYKMYEKRGVTVKDFDLTIKDAEDTKKLIEKRIRELKKIQKESQFFYDENGYDEWLEDNLDDDGEDNVASESPVSFVSQKSKPVKNQKAHLKYIKKKAHDNPTNNATGQKEMPSANSFNI